MRPVAMYLLAACLVLYVVTGPVLAERLATISPNNVSVPDYFF